MTDWQSWAAGAVVLTTLVLFIIRWRRKRPGCGGGCDCTKEK
jgi:hypothetical protein